MCAKPGSEGFRQEARELARHKNLIDRHAGFAFGLRHGSPYACFRGRQIGDAAA